MRRNILSASIFLLAFPALAGDKHDVVIKGEYALKEDVLKVKGGDLLCGDTAHFRLSGSEVSVRGGAFVNEGRVDALQSTIDVRGHGVENNGDFVVQLSTLSIAGYSLGGGRRSNSLIDRSGANRIAGVNFGEDSNVMVVDSELSVEGGDFQLSDTTHFTGFASSIGGGNFEIRDNAQVTMLGGSSLEVSGGDFQLNDGSNLNLLDSTLEVTGGSIQMGDQSALTFGGATLASFDEEDPIELGDGEWILLVLGGSNVTVTVNEGAGLEGPLARVFGKCSKGQCESIETRLTVGTRAGETFLVHHNKKPEVMQEWDQLMDEAMELLRERPALPPINAWDASIDQIRKTLDGSEIVGRWMPVGDPKAPTAYVYRLDPKVDGEVVTPEVIARAQKTLPQG